MTSQILGSKSILRNIGAVAAGLLTNIIPAVAIDAVFHAMSIYPPVGQRMSDVLSLVAFSYRLPLAIAGGYVTARLAPSNPTTHALALGAIGVVLSIAGAIAMWEAGPAWFSLSLIAIALPCSWLGARLQGQP
jgi:hypothetical protein